ncbi:MAG: hypothetical protein NT098_04320 [Candidatus Parcubacteria bacterium]|nr:hypothetical protein [Candidatus Parcubacteria bacterium]
MKVRTKKQIGIMVAITIVLCGLSFYGGMKYSGSQSLNKRAEFAGQFGGVQNGAKRTGMMRGGVGGMVSGEILSKDAKSITVKDRTGGSKMVFLGATTEVMKSAQGTIDDLAVGTSIITNGTPNADGSITAQTIQIRPAGTPEIGAPRGR